MRAAQNFLLTILSVLALLAFATAHAGPGGEVARIVTSTGEHLFKVEVADTPEMRARGLMFRKSMPGDRGMLFDFRSEGPVSMWMKNTYIPLDMVFIGRDGRVVGVAADAEPLSERIISSPAPAYAVLELNAGVARRISLAPGDQVRHRMFAR
ncbi:MAG: DUF192 domain-containing protein [Alphaproteobacteria bacterium]|nr:DUF192 domain-containing protein [Alphaproteobacteria bacterium]MBM3652761.1 DUF192 domain-containing protein [Alphaproteobacteria bacterium]